MDDEERTRFNKLAIELTKDKKELEASRYLLDRIADAPLKLEFAVAKITNLESENAKLRANIRTLMDDLVARPKPSSLGVEIELCGEVIQRLAAALAGKDGA